MYMYINIHKLYKSHQPRQTSPFLGIHISPVDQHVSLRRSPPMYSPGTLTSPGVVREGVEHQAAVVLPAMILSGHVSLQISHRGHQATSSWYKI